MKNSLIFASCAVAIGAVAIQASAMNVTVYNDTDQTTYALLTAQGCQYPNPLLKIDPHKSGSYTDLEEHHCMSAGRVYLSHTPLQNNPAQPLGGPYQLVEYTFSNNGNPTVDYDFSAVDSLYDLPLAVEASNPVAGAKIGWTGINPKGPSLTGLMAEFTKPQGDFPGWPYMKYNGSQPSYKQKIPGGYNLFALTSPTDLDQTTAKATRNYIVQRWFDWYAGKAPCQSPLTPSQCSAIQHSVVDVMNAFVANAKVNHQTALPSDVVQHILGYVPFGSSWSPINTKTSEEVIGLLSGVPTKADIHDPSYKNVVYPAATQANAFDPYVSFIHKQAKLNVYAFSIDDAIGNFYEPGYNGITIDVGSVQHLPDLNPYQPGPTPPPPSSGQYHFNMGGGWGTTQATICGQKHSFSNGGSYAFDINKTCQVTLVNPQASFTLAQDSSATNTAKPIHLENCTSSSSGFCQGVVVSGDNIDLPGGTGAH